MRDVCDLHTHAKPGKLVCKCWNMYTNAIFAHIRMHKFIANIVRQLWHWVCFMCSIWVSIS